MENYVIYRVLHRVNDNCISLTRSFSFSLIILTTQSHLHFSFLIFNLEHFKTNLGKPGILHEGFRFRKDMDSKTEPRRPIFLQRGSNTSSWPRKSCEYIGTSVTPKLSANAPLLCAQVYDRRKRFFLQNERKC